MNERCHKFGFSTEADAIRQLKLQKASSRENKKIRNKLEAYICPFHHEETWHVGHNAFKTRKSGRYERQRQLNALGSA